MPPLPETSRRLACRLLRASVVIQCVGNAWWFGWLGETPLFSLLWDQPEVGGLGLGEGAVRSIHQGLAIGWLLAGAAVAVRPPRFVLGGLAAMQVVIAAAMAWTEHGFRLDVSMLPPGADVLTFAFPLFSQSCRVAAPLALMLLAAPTPLGGADEASDPLATERLAVGVMRWTVIATFVAHGFEAMQHYYVFNELNITAANRVLGYTLSQSASEALLTVIGAVDVLVGLVAAARRSPVAAGYMALWGFITASSRVVAFGWAVGGWGFATRVPHGFVPAALLVCWLAWRSTERRTKEGE